MKKICIIGSSNLINISLISIYTNLLNKNNIHYDLIYWDRLGIEEESNADNTFRFTSNVPNSDNKFDKFILYFKFRRFIKETARKENYDVLILWQTTTAYIITDYLLFKYRKKFILNIRDYVAEKSFPCNFLIKLLVRNSMVNTISSKGFLSFLPNAEYELIQSLNSDLNYGSQEPHIYNGKAIKIGFAGACRFLKENFKIIDKLGNDNRFELWYCGINSERIENYAKENNYNNVFTTGKFQREETTLIMSQFDLINSAFGSDAIDNSTLVPIRLFTALKLHIPVIASKGSYMGNLIQESQVGIAISADDECLGDTLYKYFMSFNRSDFEKRADMFINAALSNNNKFGEKLLRKLM